MQGTWAATIAAAIRPIPGKVEFTKIARFWKNFLFTNRVKINKNVT